MFAWRERGIEEKEERRERQAKQMTQAITD
jgi:hypothetical protein